MMHGFHMVMSSHVFLLAQSGPVPSLKYETAGRPQKLKRPVILSELLNTRFLPANYKEIDLQ